MKRLVVTTALAISFLVTGLASAEIDNALFPSNNASAQVTFYRDSYPLATAMVNNSPVAPTISGIDVATSVTIAYEYKNYTFTLTEGGKNKNDVWLDIAEFADGSEAATHISGTGTMSLAALMEGLSVNPNLLEQLQSNVPGG